MPAPRVSLTAKQLETAVGIDLLALCQRITADGSVTQEEVQELTRWLDETASIELPSLGYLRGTVQRILEDGQVTQEELRELHRAVEKVMPPELRIVSEAVRKDRERADKTKQRPLARLDSMVAGSTYEGRPYVVHKHASVGDPVYLVREPSNRYSKAAIGVRLANGMSIGYVPDEDAQSIAPLLDAGALHRATIKKIWPGRRVDVPIISAELFDVNSGVTGCVAAKDCPPPNIIPASYIALAETVMREDKPSAESNRSSARAKPSGCISIALALLLFLSIVVIVLANQ